MFSVLGPSLRPSTPRDRDGVTTEVLKANEENGFEIDYRIMLPDGTVKHLHVIGNPLLNDEGSISEWVGTSMDVTETVSEPRRTGKR